MSKMIDVNKYDEMKNQSDYWEIEFNKKDLECAELKQQLAEKDKELERLKNLPRQWANQDIELARITERTEICEKIRQWYREQELIMEEWLIDCLDQIEKGE